MMNDNIQLIGYENPYWKDNPQYFLELIDLIKHHSKNGSYIHMLMANGKKRCPNIIPPYKHLRIWIQTITQQYDDKILNMTARIYWILNGLTDSPKCLNEKCSNNLDNKAFDVTKKNQPSYCSTYCLCTCKKHILKSKLTKQNHADNDKEYWKKLNKRKNRQK